jgi:outer membrane protein assembly factor BamE (lipoprotein component of BamABCDE complex)
MTVRTAFLALAFALALLAPGCRPSARSHRSYDEIRDLAAGRTAAEVETLLGPPDVRQAVLDDERWVWWSYTVLDGPQYAPEVRGQLVHLVITFQKTADGWRVGGPLAVSYSLPAPRR